MKITFDTNIILDAMIEGREGCVAAKQLILAAAEDEIEGRISANSVTDIYYIAKKYLGDAKTREAIYSLLTVFRASSIESDDCLRALELPMADFEDALLAVCSEREGADYIVTRDKDFIAAKSPVAAKSPDELLSLLRKTHSPD